jgi:endoglucanase Acf2
VRSAARRDDFIIGVTVLGLACCAPALLCAQEIVTCGAGSYLEGLPRGAHGPPPTVFANADVAQHPIPTNDWWSSLAWTRFSDVMYPHPLALRATAAGLAVYYPGATITANKAGIFGALPGDGDFTIGLDGVKEFADARVDGFSDWFVSARFNDGEKIFRTTFGHGSPFVFVTFSGGNPVLELKSTTPFVWGRLRDDAVIGFTIGTRHYAVFAPHGGVWSLADKAHWTCDTHGAGYCSVAVLPDARSETLAQFAKVAHNHVIDSKVSWQYDEARSVVTTRFALTTKAMEAGDNDDGKTLIALYPHQWKHAQATLTDKTFASVRGAMKLARGTGFETIVPFNGVLPVLPFPAGVSPAPLAAQVRVDADAISKHVADTYWMGKQLGRWSTLSLLANHAGERAAEKKCVEQMRETLENFLTATRADGSAKSSSDGLFAYDHTWGTLIGYPASYGSDTQLNDHHFHYGYFIRAAAELARRDPAWAARWGDMLRLVIRDIASADRNDPLFPFLRCFDPYAGHSWASGHAQFADGNNNESSSEAVNAWAGVIFFAEAIGDKALRDLGIWLFTTEIEAINAYWFDVTNEFHHPDYPASVVTMIWGGKGANATWFSAAPETIHGINWLPFTGASLYLGADPDYCARNYAALVAERAGKNTTASARRESGERQGRLPSFPPPSSEGAWRQWADIIWMYRALSDPADARKQFAARRKDFHPEQGNSLANVEAWITALETFGAVDASVTANIPFYAVFKTKAGRRTYVVYNFGKSERSVKFSDGQTMQCKANGFTVVPSS